MAQCADLYIGLAGELREAFAGGAGAPPLQVEWRAEQATVLHAMASALPELGSVATPTMHAHRQTPARAITCAQRAVF